MRDVRTLVVLLVSVAASATIAHAQVPPGSTRMVEVNGYSTRVLELGIDRRDAGEPVVVLFAGGGGRLELYGEWLSEVSDLAPVLAYDRPGIGQSEYDGLAQSPSHLVDHAHAVLEAVGVASPYVLVGHSWGGPLALYFAGKYPREVVGLVYLDPFDPRESQCESLLASDDQECEVRRAAGARARASLAGVPSSPGRRAENEAIQAFRDSSLEDRALPADPDVPTAVLLGTRPPPPNPRVAFMDEAYWDRWLGQRVSRYAEWVRNRPSGTLFLATDAGHFVHEDVPALATEIVRRVLAAARDP